MSQASDFDLSSIDEFKKILTDLTTLDLAGPTYRSSRTLINQSAFLSPDALLNTFGRNESFAILPSEAKHRS